MIVLLIIAAFLVGIIVGAVCNHFFGEPQHTHEWEKIVDDTKCAGGAFEEHTVIYMCKKCGKSKVFVSGK